MAVMIEHHQIIAIAQVLGLRARAYATLVPALWARGKHDGMMTL
jgi:hypothetical protein